MEHCIMIIALCRLMFDAAAECSTLLGETMPLHHRNIYARRTSYARLRTEIYLSEVSERSYRVMQ